MIAAGDDEDSPVACWLATLLQLYREELHVLLSERDPQIGQHMWAGAILYEVLEDGELRAVYWCNRAAEAA